MDNHDAAFPRPATEEMKSIKLLSEIGQDITSSLSIESIIETTYDKVNGLMDASTFGIGIYNEAEQCIDFPGVIEKGVTLPFSSNYLTEDRYSSYCFNNRKEIFIRDVAKENHLYTNQILEVKVGEDTESVIYLPLITKGTAIGVLTVQAFTKNAYTSHHLSVLRIIAAYAATAIENAKAYSLIEAQKQEIEKKNLTLESEVQKRTAEIIFQKEELEAQRDEIQRAYRNIKLLSESGQKITASLTIEDIISKVYENVNTLMDASSLGIGIYNDTENRIDFPGTIEKGVTLPFSYDSLTDESLSGWCFKNQKEIFINDFATEYLKYMPKLKIRAGESTSSIIYLPLNIKDRNLGVITVQSFRLYAYHSYHVALLRNLAAYIVIAIENAEAYKKLNQTLETLKNTQAQLIQSEKMASLGELTAGIAHEIQNPLNFINNFSETNRELLEELQEALKNGNLKEVTAIASDLISNEEKINHHGKRAEAIVRNMLQHSRVSKGEKQPTDVNALAEEYLRLAYHGFRAKEKSFNVVIETDFDATIGTINTVPQDIGRVLLNLFNNAFYAAHEKMKKLGSAYKPFVTVSTRKGDKNVEIVIKDNGMGISKNVMEKVFQPFFTTKPAGEGTGLGLSLSYDIIKSHGGKLQVASEEGQYSQFTIQLPRS